MHLASPDRVEREDRYVHTDISCLATSSIRLQAVKEWTMLQSTARVSTWSPKQFTEVVCAIDRGPG